MDIGAVCDGFFSGMIDGDEGFFLIVKDGLAAVEAGAVLAFPDGSVFSVYFLDAVEPALFVVVAAFDIGVHVIAGAFDRSKKGIQSVVDYVVSALPGYLQRSLSAANSLAQAE